MYLDFLSIPLCMKKSIESPILFVFLLAILGCQQTAEAPTEADPSVPWYESQLIDLTHSFDSATIYWPTEKGFILEKGFEGYNDLGFFYEENAFYSAEHGGTHLDAPVHFSKAKQSVEEIPLRNLIGPGIVIDVSSQCLENADYQITPEDILAWEEENGAIPDGTLVLFGTGYSSRWPDRQSYLGTAAMGPEAVAELHFPGIHPDAAQWLVENRNIAAAGIDTPSIDYGQSTLFESHRILYTENIPGFENVANLNQLPASGFTVIALPMKIRSGSGAPLRIVAVIQ